MAEPQILADNDRGQTCVEGNAFCQDSKILDAAELRIGSPAAPGQSGGGGKLSIDVLLPETDDDGRHKRRAIVELRGGEGSLGAEVKLGVLKQGGETSDADMKDIFQYHAALNHLEFLVPISAPNLGPPVAATVTRMWAPNGMSFTQQQDDGNFVTYTTTVSYSIAPEHVTAVWSAWTGKLT